MKIRTLEFFKKKMTTSSFPLIHQPDAMDCGPACLGMIAAHYGKGRMRFTQEGFCKKRISTQAGGEETPS